MKFLKTLAAAALALPLSVGAAATAHAAGGLGDGDNNGLADAWVTIDANKYYSATDRNGVTEYYYKDTDQNFLKLGWKGNIGLGTASAMAALPDVTGDGKADMMVRFGDHLYLYKGTGSRTTPNLTKSIEIGHGWGAMDTLVFAGHLNGDSANYLLGRSSVDHGLYAYKFTGSGSVTTVGKVGKGWGGMKYILSPGQMAGDSKTDLIGITDKGDMYCYAGTGLGTVTSLGQCGHGWTGFMSVFIPGDMNKDGKWDLVGVKNVTHPNVYGEPTLPSTDVNGDGKITLSDVPPQDRAPMYLYTNNGGAKWGSATMIGYDMFQFRLFA